MTLTADDVLNQKFTITKFRDGYDLDQVDDFLDTIVDQFKALEDEKAALEAQVQELQAKLDAANEQLEEAQKTSNHLESDSPQVSAVASSHESTQQEAPVEQQTDVSPDALKSSAMLQLALELHDKHVREGEETKAELISNAEKKAHQLVSEAQEQRANELKMLGDERLHVESVIEDLRLYESEYRTTLRSYIEAQLKNLDVTVGDKITPEIN
ncbi:MAG TPA: DivIVA domain-containing protein [Microbacteriaceae bacterium]|nr:DivIVA domain-containing protein [Microbacteriaceae bacterium]